MFSLKKFGSGWNRFFYSTTDASVLSIFRILLGACLFLNGISLIEDFYAWFGVGDEALVPVLDSFTYYRDLRINVFKIMSPTELTAQVVLGSYILSSVCMMIGYKTRVATVMTFILLASLQNRNYAILNSGDTVMRCMLFVMMFAPSQVKYSVDAILRRNRGIPYKTQIPILTVRLLQLQFSLIYLATTLFKLKGYDWVDGTAIYYTSRLVNFQRVVLPFVFDFPSLVKFITWSTLFIEFAMGSLVWVKELRIWVLLAGILLHVGIEVSMSIGFFEWVMMSSYILFLRPRELSWLAYAFRRLLPRKLQPAAIK